MATASREFQVMVKPIGSLCNLNCRYCYYLKKRNLYPKVESFRMADDVLETYIVQHIEVSPKKLIFFSWHGGEPTILGLDYFRRIVELEEKHRPAGRQILNGIQTNGTLLDETWCRFLAARNFQVGISIDGPKELHDCHRVTNAGMATHKQIMQALRLLKAFKVSFDVLCVVHQKNVQRPAAVYRFFKELGIPFLQFLPLINREGETGVTAESASAQAYGEFLCAVFDEWVRNDIGRITIQNFDEAARPFLGEEHALCIFRQICGDVIVVEHNGDVYCCDHFVDPEHRIGNIREQPLVDLLESPALRQFGQQKTDGLPRYCRECEVLSSCNGGCLKDRFIRAPDGEFGLNYLCAGLKHFFIHTRPYLEKMAALNKAGAKPERLMDMIQSGDTLAFRQAGRNDPCPCGSGRKYKKCCMGKSPALS
jgi:uncharacterized protein